MTNRTGANSAIMFHFSRLQCGYKEHIFIRAVYELYKNGTKHFMKGMDVVQEMLTYHDRVATTATIRTVSQDKS